MDLLLDSHVFLWWDMGDARLAANVREAIADPENRVLLSAVSVWEIAIKRGLGKLAFRGSLIKAIAANGFEELPVTAVHAERAAALPEHHRDPFDRMLVAQSLCEACVLVTRDRAFEAYGIPCLWS
jgi:PIN domain nuclease of toxin-antitoxin system